MKIYRKYVPEIIGEVPETRPGELDAFLSEDSNVDWSESSRLLRTLRNTLDSGKEEFAVLLSRETGNNIASCREEISASMELLESSVSYSSDGRSDSGFYSDGYKMSDFQVFSDRIPINNVLVIISGLNPLLHFTEALCASLVTGSRLLVKPSSIGLLSVVKLFKAIEREAKKQFLVVVLNPEGTAFRKVLRDERVSRILFSGNPDNLEKVRKAASRNIISYDTPGRCYAVVWNDSDPDGTARTIVSLALKGLKSQSFTPHRVIIDEKSFEYLSNRIVEETLILRYGDPENEETDTASFISTSYVQQFLQDIEDEKKNWSEQLTDQLTESNSVAPVIFSSSETPGPLWDRTEFGPFIIIRGADSFAQAIEYIKADRLANSVFLFTSDLGLTRNVWQVPGMRFVMTEPHSEVCISDLARIQDGFGSLVQNITEKRKKVMWK